MTRTIAHRRGGLVLLAIATMTMIAGCTAQAEPTPAPTTVSPSSATPTPETLALQPEGNATDNLPFFTQIVQTVAGAGGPDAVAGRAYIDALAAGGFDKAAMQVTQDRSTVGNPAESLQFSVRWGEECLIGQVGPATGAPVTEVMPGLASGGCLVGNTRQIDW